MQKRENKAALDLIRRLNEQGCLEKEQWIRLLSCKDPDVHTFAKSIAAEIAQQRFGNRVFIRGLIEFSNHCRKNCLYCGIRRNNGDVSRYRLEEAEILSCCRTGYDLGFRTFVLQSGEDPYFTAERMAHIIRAIKTRYSDCALTLSIGEREHADYQAFYDAGADRFLLRHETADAAHYGLLHPKELQLDTRMRCLKDLREIGFQTGCGLMVGSPGQTIATLAEDFLFMHRFQPHMVGIGPFIPHHATPFRGEPAGTLEQTLFLLSLTRIMLKNVLLPATTALGTIHPDGREMGILCGANVVMPNLSPIEVRSSYLLYDNKRNMGDEAAEGLRRLRDKLQRIGYVPVVARGDWSGETDRSDCDAV